MAGLNKVQLIGRLGKDPEVRNLDNGSKVCNFSLATSESWKDKTTGEKKERTEWHNIVIWGALSDIAQKYLHKGDQVYLEGAIRTRSWEKDGVTRYTTEIFIDNLVMLGSKGPSSNSGSYNNSTPQNNEQSKPAATNSGPGYGDDDLPF